LIPFTGWYITGKVLGRTGDEFRVDMTWERRWDRGQPSIGAQRGTTQMTMRPGDRVTLDEVLTPAEAAARCSTVVARLEAGIAVRPSMAGGVVIPLLGRGGGRGVGGAGGTRGGGGTGSGGAGSRPQEILDLQAPVTHQAELWLVHTRPDGSEAVQRQALGFGRAWQQFDFPSVGVTVDGVRFDVRVRGALRVIDGPQVDVSLSRAMVREGSGAAGGGGRAAKAIPMPRPADVVSFEIPSGDARGHRFSVRLRIGPR
jgi:hypothetical protein